MNILIDLGEKIKFRKKPIIYLHIAYQIFMTIKVYSKIRKLF